MCDTADPRSPAERAWSDRRRPQFHFVPPAGWLNDPNGVGQWGSQFHLFYQYNPDAPVHDRVHWGHARSADLLHWVDEPIALAPDSPADADGCWSGVLVDDAGIPTLVYSGHRGALGQLPCVAVGDPDLRTWTKDPANPVITERPPDLVVLEYRDHCVWREGEGWRQLIGAGVAGLGGTALLYESDDLRRWRYLGPLLGGPDLEPGGLWTGSVWECVELVRFPGAHREAPDVLIFSVWSEGQTHYPVYVQGRYVGERLHITTQPQLLDLGRNYFYAPQSFTDSSGRRVMFGWAQEGRPDSEAVESGWSGTISLPREMWLDDGGRLRQAPVAELDRLRGEPLRSGPLDLSAGVPRWLDEVHGTQLDILLTVEWGACTGLELGLLASPGGEEQTTLWIEPGDFGPVGVRLDRSRSSLAAGMDVRELAGPAHPPEAVPGGAERPGCRVRVLIDHSMIEVFVNDTPLTARVYPSRADAVGFSVTARAAGPASLELSSWPVESVWQGPRDPRPPAV